MNVRNPILGLFAGLATLFATEGLRAQVDEGTGLWFMVFGQGGLGGLDDGLQDLRWWLDMQDREDASSRHQVIVRPGVGYAFAENAAAWFGYAWLQTNLPNSGHFEENRLWQQVTWSPGTEPIRLMVRPRLEERWVDTGDDVGWRFRLFLKATYPLAFEDRLLLASYDEVFFDLNDTDWGQDTGFSQNRFFAGLGWRFDAAVTLEVGYLNHYVYRQSGDDLMNHVLNVNLLLSF